MSYFDDKHGYYDDNTAPPPSFKQVQSLKRYCSMKTCRPMNDDEKEALKVLVNYYLHL
nr:MAG TPA_asm: hypothetical protein [Caudoviricetes sp.]